MGDIIEVNFRKKTRIQKYTVVKNICIVCFKNVIYDSRCEDNEPYIEVPKTKGQCICRDCAIAIKEVVDDNEWDK